MKTKGASMKTKGVSMRQPYNVLVLPYYQDDEVILYAVFKRSDAPIWQGIAGGVEANETHMEAAKRESFEEAGISLTNDYIELDATASIPAYFFGDMNDWGKELYVVKEISYGVKLLDQSLTLSSEHHCYEWLTYEKALEKFEFDSNKVALWELNERLKVKG